MISLESSEADGFVKLEYLKIFVVSNDNAIGGNFELMIQNEILINV